MTTEVMLKLGEFTFSLNTASYHQLSKTRKYRWQAINRINTINALQYLGVENTTITVQGSLYPGLGLGLKQLAPLINEAGLGKPLLLVDGLGHIHGYWVIDSIDETQSFFAINGTPKKITFSLGLTFYGNKI